MISLARIAARSPRALVEESVDVDDCLIIEDGPYTFTVWRKQQPVPTNLCERKDE